MVPPPQFPGIQFVISIANIVYINILQYHVLNIRSMMAAVLDDNYDHFDTKYYLENYFGLTAIHAKLDEYVPIFSQFPDDSLTMLNFGGGPDLLPLLYAAHKTKEYVQADYAQNNLTEVERWVKGDPSAFSWQGHVKHCLELENKGETVESREKRMRDVFKAAVRCDLTAEQVISEEYRGPYDYVICSGVLDSVCRSPEAFAMAVRKLSGLVKVGGYLHIEMSYGTEDTKCSGCYEVGKIVYETVLSVTKAQITESIKAAGLTIMRELLYLDDCEATAKYKDYAVLVVAGKKRIDS